MKAMDVSDVIAPEILSSIPQHDDDSKHLDREGRNTATHVAREVALLASASRHMGVSMQYERDSVSSLLFRCLRVVPESPCLAAPVQSLFSFFSFLNTHDFSCTHRLDASLVFIRVPENDSVEAHAKRHCSRTTGRGGSPPRRELQVGETIELMDAVMQGLDELKEDAYEEVQTETQ